MNNNSPQQPGAGGQHADRQASHPLDRYTAQPQNDSGKDSPFYKPSAPTISLPKGGGALRGIDEKFSVNAVNGTAGLELPLPLSPGRGGFTPALSLSYNSGGGNSPFGLGWNLGLPSIQRKTDKKLPQYHDDIESDVFLLAGAEDLVPKLRHDDSLEDEFITDDQQYFLKRYVPRIEGLFARIEYIRAASSGEAWWRVTTKDNITTYYGLTAEGRIADPEDAGRVFQWLPQLSTDHKGNVQHYTYVTDTNTSITVPGTLFERNRKNGNQPFTNTYLKSVQYGNEEPWFVPGEAVYQPSLESLPGFLMKAVLDYGEHSPEPAEVQAEPEDLYDFPIRRDAFSSFHAGFEIRTYRQCRRILMFHYFEALRAADDELKSLVRSLDLEYSSKGLNEDELTEADLLLKATQTGYVFDAYSDGWHSKSLPPMQFTYQDRNWDTTVHTVDEDDFRHAPQGLTGPYQWTDLEGEGISGILTEQAGGWFYKNNLGDGHFAPARSVSPKPSFQGLGSQLQWQDLDADGRRQLVAQGMVKGYWELDHSFTEMPGKEGTWGPFRTFARELNIDWESPFTKMLDLDGDGKADILITEDRAWTWYHNDGKEGYSRGGSSMIFTDEEKGPVLLLRDAIQSIFLADMNGDGMTDLVRIKNGEVCYWPNMGYGKFGAKVSMLNAPLFAAPDRFNPLYLSLADISGTGAADLVYLDGGKALAWINYSGNGWSDVGFAGVLPSTDPYSKIAITDFLGNGTGCLVWSSPLPQHTYAPLRYIDLMGGVKPYLMLSYHNNMGKTVTVTYKSSTQYYLEDKRSGYPWATRLPFPVQCISEVSTSDAISETEYKQQYRYRHGYYDHEEREFRGFGYVETLDSDKAVVSGNEELDQAPILTKTWNHTGAWMRQGLLTRAYQQEYFDVQEWEDGVNDMEIESGLSAQEQREAFRALKGSPLRQEVYALDADGDPGLPYTVTATAYSVRRVQQLPPEAPVEGTAPQHAVFLVQKLQRVAYSTEGNAADARVMQELVLETDRYGNVKKSAQIAIRRKPLEDPGTDTRPDAVAQDQDQSHITFTLTEYTNDIRRHNLRYRLRLPWESKSYELTGFTDKYAIWTHDELLVLLDDSELPESGITKRLLSHSRTLFRENDAVTVLEPGKLHSLAIPHESYTKAFSEAMLNDCFGAGSVAAMGGFMGGRGGYVTPAGQEGFWIPSGTAIYTDPEERFYTPSGYTDPWGNVTTVSFGAGPGNDNYWMLPHSVTDAAGNTSTVNAYDWRILQPLEMADANGNISEILYDALGLPVAMAVKGKGTGPIGTEGDKLTKTVLINEGQEDEDSVEVPCPNLYDYSDVAGQAGFFENPLLYAEDLLGNATWRCVYDLESQPIAVGMIARETHLAALPAGTDSKLVIRLSYTDGLGRVMMHKAQAASLYAPNPDPGEPPIETLRWVGTGRTIYNNEGKAVMQYEPYFSDTHECDEAEQAALDGGVSPKMFYDPLGRLYRTEMPDGTLSETAWTSWEQTVWDANDTVLESDWYAQRQSGGSLYANAGEADAAVKAAAHAATPTVMYTDSLARPFYTIQQDGISDPIHSYVVLDVQGNRLEVKDGIIPDPLDGLHRTPLTYKYNMLQQPCHQHSIDSGDTCTLTDVAGQPLYARDAMDNTFIMVYDELRRLLEKWMAPIPEEEEAPDGLLLERIIYGEGVAGAIALNLRGQVYEHYDGSGKQWMPEGYDFKGNPVIAKQSLLADPTLTDPDWNVLDDTDLDSEVFESQAKMDALGRPVWMKDPGGNETEYRYDRGGALRKVSLKKAATTAEPAPAFVDYVKDIHYDAKGQRQSIWYGNGTKTRYTYDPLTYRLRRLLTVKLSDNSFLQDLYYYYDPVGNITSIEDDLEDTLFYDNSAVEARQDFTYDALYRLIKAKGREYATAAGEAVNNWENTGFNSSDLGTSAVRNYCQHYAYDAVGNILSLQHVAGAGSYTRNYTYESGNNRLAYTEMDGSSGTPFSYDYDDRGNMEAMPHLSLMQWNLSNELNKIVQGVNTAYYQYGGGQRIRKYVNKGSIKEERIYLGGLEIYRKFEGSSLTLQRTTVHISDDTGRLAMLEVKDEVYDDDTSADELIRYIYSNHLQSASLELDQDAEIISYEEYHPYGTTAYYYQNAAVNAVAKRYRYTGKERDEESGLYYHGARYYVPWLCRWCAVDPKESERAGLSPYDYCSNNPVNRVDDDGMKDEKKEKVENHENLNFSVTNQGIDTGSSDIKIEGNDIIWTGASFTERDIYKIVFLNKILGFNWNGEGKEKSYEDDDNINTNLWEKAANNVTFFFSHHAPAFSSSEPATKNVYQAITKQLFSGDSSEEEKAIEQINKSEDFLYKHFVGTLAIDVATIMYGGLKGLLTKKLTYTYSKDAFEEVFLKLANQMDKNVVKDFNVKVSSLDGKRLVAEFDVLTDKHIIELTKGDGGGKFKQITKNVIPNNTQNKEVLMLAPRLKGGLQRVLEKDHNVKVFRSFNDIWNYITNK